MEPAFTPVANPTASEAVADVLRRAVAVGAIQPGQRLPPERELARSLGVARMTLRAAVRTLNDEGLLITSRGRSGGTMVAQEAPPRKGPADSAGKRLVAMVADNMEVRLAVEPLAAALCAARGSRESHAEINALVEEQAASMRHYRLLDSRFHLAIAQASGNAVLVETIERLRTDFFLWADTMFIHLEWEGLPAVVQDFSAEHRDLARAIAARDAARAEELTRRHISDGLATIEKLLESSVR
jgi:DNA-binding FadR family transcriptional regulator